MASKELSIIEHAVLNGFNILLIGNHGVGKTMMVKEVLEKLKINWKYFSASTIDPWVDLVGVPKEKDGVLDLVRPATLDFDNLEVIFLDEYNRAPKKVRNAVMELIQFGSINGKKFPKLKIVIAAINPDDDEELTYDVEKLDPAQLDRFHIHLPVPNKPCPYYFKSAHGSTGTLAVKWWDSQPHQIQKLISPRRLEAGVKVFLAKGDPQYVFDPEKINVGEFCEYLDKPDPLDLLDDIITKSDEDKKKFLNDPNTFKHVKKDLMGKGRYLKELLHLVPEAELMNELRDKRGNKVIGHVVSNIDKFEKIIPTVLNYPKAYSAKVVDSFRAYKRNNDIGIDPTKSHSARVNIKGVEYNVSRLNLCFAGALSGYTTEQAKEVMARYNVTTSDNITMHVTHIVTGENKRGTSAKLERAKRQGVEIITENDFYKLIQQLDTAS